MVQFRKTPIVPFRFQGVLYFVKREDLLHPIIDGTKGRKFYSLLHRPLEGVEELVGFGSPLANSFSSLAYIARQRGWRFRYFVTYIPPQLRREPAGNFQKGLEWGAEVVETGLTGEALREFVLGQRREGRVVVEEGGRGDLAEEGVSQLAREILGFCKSHNLPVFLPSGTGTTAYYLAKYLQPEGVKVYTTPVVGGVEYLQKQFQWLGGGEFLPTILPPLRHYRFGALYPNLYRLWEELGRGGIEFDLLYDPVGWEVVLGRQLGPLLYIHQGGKLGNLTMLARYRKLFEKERDGKR
jgi:1-aminocyclopropane-1-carboxylate deaminase/D-cysteine desulfhydrase-like pyridoxal-dependent ACC family enzyme